MLAINVASTILLVIMSVVAFIIKFPIEKYVDENGNFRKKKS